MELDLDAYLGCGLGNSERTETRQGEKEIFEALELRGCFGGEVNKVREVLGGRLDENVGPILAFVVSVEMKQEHDQAEASTRRVLNIDESTERA